ncbi:MAG: hypothetical protein A4E62_00998 [Syntrophorhabdus sp. PtaU1.Bin002]|nr:MAG: hypothetical protein A4E58_00685 [Syntrophorhabdus sp. PtaB.Bin006]OPY72078.1 MAG: hypothetical protein A4E62_00998 [Syntrophorhabdus sp. PtaU1.Bin002]
MTARTKMGGQRPARTSANPTMNRYETTNRLKDCEMYYGFRTPWAPLLIIFSIVFAVLSLAHAAHALEVPPLKGYVNDYANMISKPAQSKLEAELKAFERTDSTQLVILTIPSLEGETIEEFSIRVAEAWKIGQKGKDNGIVFLVSAKEKRIRIEVGRGLEGRLTDLTAGRIIDLVVKPRFKRGDFSGGFVAGVSALIDATKGEFKAEEAKPARKGRSLSPIFTLLLFAGIGLLFLGSFSRLVGGIAGAIGLPGIAFLTIGPSLITLILLGLLGSAMGIFLPLLFSGGGHGRGGTFLPGGGFFGTGGGGNFDSGGGFGGGGGDFGGGGASGDW